MGDLVEVRGRWSIGANKDLARRLHALPDRFLARAILDLCRAARESRPKRLVKRPDECPDYGAFLVWDIGPEIAARLGERDFRLLERSAGVRMATSLDLRHWAWNALCASRAMETECAYVGEDPWNGLRKEVGAGNPLFIGLDRIEPPSRFDAANDPASARVAVSCISRGRVPRLSWTPEMMTPPSGNVDRWRQVLDGLGLD